MNLITLAQGEPWMTPSELNLNRAFIRATAAYLAAVGVPETPFLTLRISDLVSTWLLSRRLETALTPAEGQPAPCPTIALAGAIGKSRERLRRAIKELEQCCARTATSVRQGIIEQMHQAVLTVQAADPIDEPAAASGNTNTTPKPENHDPDQSKNPDPTNNPGPAQNAPTEHTIPDCQTASDRAKARARVHEIAREYRIGGTSRTNPGPNRPDSTPAATDAGMPLEPPHPREPHNGNAIPTSEPMLTWTARAKAPPREGYRK